MYPKAKRILVVGLSSVALFLVIVYWIFSCTLLTPAFYRLVFKSRTFQASLPDTSEFFSREGYTLFTDQSLKENAYSLAEGILRFIKQEDMSLSSIQLESENTQSIRSAVLSAVPEQTAEVPEISRIHPFVIAYFLPGSDNIYAALFSVQRIYAVLHSGIPLLLILTMLLLLLSKETAENIKAVCISTGTVTLLAAAIMLLFRQPLLLSPLSDILPDFGAMIPVVNQAVTYLVLFSVMTGAILFLAVPAVKLQPVKRFLNRFSRSFAVLLIALAGLFFILFNNEVFANTLQTVKANAEQQQVKILAPGDGAVHSLIIKLREIDTQAPVKNVKLILLRVNDNSEPLQFTAYSDENGDARFILPEGEFLLFADPATVPDGFTCFEPAVLTLDRPDSSWYTFHLARSDNGGLNRGAPKESYSRFPDLPQPLLK
jgi:hypothetical protein